jgi:hypothetical protein
MLVPHILDGAAEPDDGRVSDWNIRRPLDTIKAQPATSSQFGQQGPYREVADSGRSVAL